MMNAIRITSTVEDTNGHTLMAYASKCEDGSPCVEVQAVGEMGHGDMARLFYQLGGVEAVSLGEALVQLGQVVRSQT